MTVEEIAKRFPYGFRLVGESDHPNFKGFLLTGEPAKTVEEWLARYGDRKSPAE